MRLQVLVRKRKTLYSLLVESGGGYFLPESIIFYFFLERLSYSDITRSLVDCSEKMLSEH